MRSHRIGSSHHHFTEEGVLARVGQHTHPPTYIHIHTYTHTHTFGWPCPPFRQPRRGQRGTLSEAESEEEDKDDAEVPPGELTGSETGSEKSTLQRFVRRLALRGGSGAWLFALLGRLELPLVPESQTVLQGFLHQCCAARVMLAELSPAATAGQGGS
eukprot:RCo005027